MKRFFPVLACGLCLATSSVHAAPTKPNIVLVMADDQGWGDTGYNGHPELKTPNLDQLAASGLRFDRFYTAHFNCSPTRASVMTGRHPHRMGTFGPGSPIRPQEITVAKVLQSAGYATGHFGKWHLNGKNGDKNTKAIPGRAVLASDPLSPGKMGFDEWVSADNFFDLDPVLGRNGVPEKFHGDGSDVVTDEALKFIRKQAAAGKPFLTVVWFGNPHTPHEALPADKAIYSALAEKDQNYYGEITGIDRNVGKLRTALRELKVADNTLLWYCSDNGGAAGPKSTGDLRGSKGTLWEGGLRVPGLVEWPARIPQPFVSQMPCCTSDIYPTVLEATAQWRRTRSSRLMASACSRYSTAKPNRDPSPSRSGQMLAAHKTTRRCWIGRTSCTQTPEPAAAEKVTKATRRFRRCCSTTYPKTRRKPPTSPRTNPIASRK